MRLVRVVRLFNTGLARGTNQGMDILVYLTAGYPCQEPWLWEGTKVSNLHQIIAACK